MAPLAPKAPKQNFGCQPQTLEEALQERGGRGPGGTGVLVSPFLLRRTAVLIHHWGRGGLAQGLGI